MGTSAGLLTGEAVVCAAALALAWGLLHLIVGRRAVSTRATPSWTDGLLAPGVRTFPPLFQLFTAEHERRRAMRPTEWARRVTYTEPGVNAASTRSTTRGSMIKLCEACYAEIAEDEPHTALRSLWKPTPSDRPEWRTLYLHRFGAGTDHCVVGTSPAAPRERGSS